MKTLNRTGQLRLFIAMMVMVLFTGIAGNGCKKSVKPDPGDLDIPENYGTLEVDFEIPVYRDIQKGIRRADLAVCNSMLEMNLEKFLYRTNVSDVKQLYQINLPEGSYYYRAVITCTCGGDSCIQGGFPYGYGGMKYAFDEVNIVKGKKTYSKPSFQ